MTNQMTQPLSIANSVTPRLSLGMEQTPDGTEFASLG